MKTGAKKANPNNGRSFILASGSPRRKELLKDLVSDFRVITSEAQEIQFHKNGPISLVEENARLKADSVALDYPFDWVLGADTLVFYKERILGKPKDMDEAKEMLFFLSGKTHQVATGVSFHCRDLNFEKTFSQISEVTFKGIDERVISNYFSMVDPLDKAGAYAIQTRSDLIIEKFVGSFSNIVGLPIEGLRELFLTLPKMEK